MMNLERAILLVLSASKKAIPATIIEAGIGQFLSPIPPLADIERTLGQLARKGHAKGTADDDEGTLWKETADGRLRIS
jgi:hypothetical protein